MPEGDTSKKIQVKIVTSLGEEDLAQSWCMNLRTLSSNHIDRNTDVRP